jgi:hypothetical protein
MNKNLKEIHDNSGNTRYKVCSRCNYRKPIKSFAKQKLKGKYYYKPYCCACQSSRHKLKHPEVRKSIVDRGKQKYRANQMLMKYELMKSINQTCCKVCNYTDIRALTFHHRIEKDKLFAISYGFTHSYSFKTLLKEAKKCDVLCQNCHSIVNTKVIVPESVPQMEFHYKAVQ